MTQHVRPATMQASASSRAATGRSPHGATEHSQRTALARMLRALRLDRSVYAEVERDPAATRQAAGVVALVAASAALGTVLLESWHPGAILGAVAAALIHWLLWSAMESLIGRVLFRRHTPLEGHVRALGFAQAPQLLAVLAFVPLVGSWAVVGARLLTLLAGNQALAATLELRRRQALAIRVASFAVAFVAGAAVRAALGDAPFLTALLRP